MDQYEMLVDSPDDNVARIVKTNKLDVEDNSFTSDRDADKLKGFKPRHKVTRYVNRVQPTEIPACQRTIAVVDEAGNPLKNPNEFGKTSIVKINGKRIVALLDSGGYDSIMSQEAADYLQTPLRATNDALLYVSGYKEEFDKETEPLSVRMGSTRHAMV